MELRHGHNPGPGHKTAATAPADEVRAESDGCFSWAQAAGMGFLTFNSIMAIKRSIDDPWNVAFVVCSYLDLLLLFFCLHIFEKTPEDSPRRGRLKVAVWSLSTLLTVMFSYKVAAIMPVVMKVVIWLMSGSTVGAGFYVLFIFHDNPRQSPHKGADLKEVGAKQVCRSSQADLV